MKSKLLEHVSAIRIRICGHLFKELLENAGLALFDQMADLSRVEAAKTIELSVHGDTVEELFMAWIRELLYIFHGEAYLLKEFMVKEVSKGTIKDIAKGEKIDPDRHLIHGEVKGETYHGHS
jgi:SHS2 domain-containing protein